MANKKQSRAIQLITTAIAVGLASQANAINLQAGDVDARIYGYANLTMTYDLDDNLAGLAQEGSFTRISSSGSNGHFGASANQSRIGILVNNPEGVKANVEGDFYAGTLRLRHAYGSYNGILAGQTWSNFTSFAGATPVIDFNGVAGNAGLWHREPQIRYTTGNLSLSVENPRSRLANSEIRNSSPALTARFESKTDSGAFAVAALTKQNTYDTGANDDSTLAFAAFATGKIFLSDAFSVQGALNYSNGANRYLYQSNADDAYVANGSIENINAYGGNIGASLNLGGGSSINLVAGMVKNDWDDALADGVATGGEAETNRNILLNYQWIPLKNVNMGVELSNWHSEYVNGTDEDANRIMFATRYSF
ncbi:DcaP family trimeric outer membrane transporter [Marinobacter sp. PE14]